MRDRDLYRGRRLDNGEWAQGYHCGPVATLNDHIIYAIDDGHGYEVDPSTVGQCMGLRDKNGTLIFEGDILSDNFKPDDVFVGIVGWSKITLSYVVRRRDTLSHIPLIDFTDSDNVTCKTAEIVGTTHDTPELMEGNDEQLH